MEMDKKYTLDAKIEKKLLDLCEHLNDYFNKNEINQRTANIFLTSILVGAVKVEIGEENLKGYFEDLIKVLFTE